MAGPASVSVIGRCICQSILSSPKRNPKKGMSGLGGSGLFSISGNISGTGTGSCPRLFIPARGCSVFSRIDGASGPGGGDILSTATTVLGGPDRGGGRSGERSRVHPDDQGCSASASVLGTLGGSEGRCRRGDRYPAGVGMGSNLSPVNAGALGRWCVPGGFSSDGSDGELGAGVAVSGSVVDVRSKSPCGVGEPTAAMGTVAGVGVVLTMDGIVDHPDDQGCSASVLGTPGGSEGRCRRGDRYPAGVRMGSNLSPVNAGARGSWCVPGGFSSDGSDGVLGAGVAVSSSVGDVRSKSSCGAGEPTDAMGTVAGDGVVFTMDGIVVITVIGVVTGVSCVGAMMDGDGVSSLCGRLSGAVIGGGIISVCWADGACVSCTDTCFWLVAVSIIEGNRQCTWRSIVVGVKHFVGSGLTVVMRRARSAARKLISQSINCSLQKFLTIFRTSLNIATESCGAIEDAKLRRIVTGRL